MRRVNCYRYTIPVETGVILRQCRLKQREGLLVELHENGQVGWGEIAPLPEFSSEDLPQAEQQLKQWRANWLNGQDDDLDRQYAPSVAFGISCALAELQGELGSEGRYDTSPLCYGDPDELYAKLQQMSGEKVAKMKVGLYEANRDGLIADMFLTAIPDLKLRLDANRAWTLEKAAQFAAKIAESNKKRIQFIEEPCRTPAMSMQFAAQHNIAIAWDETTREPNLFAKKSDHLTAFIIKPTLIGSLQKCIRLIEYAHQQGLTAVISSSIESSLALTQLARFAAQYTPNTTPGLDTLNLMQTQLLRPWQNSPLPLANLNSSFITPLAL